MKTFQKHLENIIQIGGWLINQVTDGDKSIKIDNMPLGTTTEHLTDFLKKRGLNIIDIIKIPNTDEFIINFQSNDVAVKERNNLILALTGNYQDLPSYVSPFGFNCTVSKVLDDENSIKIIGFPFTPSITLESLETFLKSKGIPLIIPSYKIPLSNSFLLNFRYHDTIIKERNNVIKLLEEYIKSLLFISSDKIPILPSSIKSLSDESLYLSLTLSPVSVPVIVESTDNKILTIEKGLKEFGLKNIKITDEYSIDNYFDKIIENSAKLSDYVNEFYYDNYHLVFKYKNSKNEDSEKKFVYGNYIASGSYNETRICTDENDKNYVLRVSTSSKILYQKKSFYENIKHCILYILIRKYIGNIKFIPQVYYIGIRKTSRGSFETICIMDKGEDTLHNSITNFTYEEIQKIFLMIYNSLFLIEDKLKINFKHNDLKSNNILVSSEKKPLIIDFGFCEFILEGIRFKTLYYGNHQYFNSSYFGYNIVLDMIQLFTSLYNTKYLEPYKIFTFKKNKGTNILDSIVLIRYLEKKFPPDLLYKDIIYRLKTGALFLSTDKLDKMNKSYLNIIFYSFYNSGKYNLVIDKNILPNKIGYNDDKPIYSDDVDDVSIFITPTELADNIGIPLPKDDDYDKFEMKYRKYKEKYLKLKNKLI